MGRKIDKNKNNSEGGKYNKKKIKSFGGHKCIQGVQGGPERLTFDLNNMKALWTMT